MGLFEMIVAIVVITSAAEVIKAYVKRSGSLPKAAEERIRQLENAVRDQQAHLTEEGARIDELAEQIDFVENLLARPPDPNRLPSRRTDA